MNDKDRITLHGQGKVDYTAEGFRVNDSLFIPTHEDGGVYVTRQQAMEFFDLRDPATQSAAFARGVDAALHERFPSQCGHSLIALERSRQQLVEGFDNDRDDAYARGELAAAAASYAVVDVKPGFPMLAESFWPWSRSWWKPTTPIRNLQKAGAMIAAEIDRRLRAGERP